MKKHAYLIIAHNNFYTLERLLRLLDDERNDIFLHIDKKVKDFDFRGFAEVCRKARVIYPPKRMDVRWGTQSQVLTEMLLFGTAMEHGPYRYYHLLSGVDLPLKTQQEIHAFFETTQDIFLCYGPQPSKWDVQRISRYHRVFPDRGLGTRLNGWLGLLQEKLGVDRLKHTGLTLKKGGNWASLPQCAVEYLVANQKIIKKITRFSSCADEVYKQTVLLSGGFDVNPEDWRYLEYYSGSDHPKVFTASDFETLMEQNKFFARKFDENTDREIIDRVYSRLQKEA